MEHENPGGGGCSGRELRGGRRRGARGFSTPRAPRSGIFGKMKGNGMGSSNGPLRVGIGGPVGAGKTTLTEGAVPRDGRALLRRRDHQRHLHRRGCRVPLARAGFCPPTGSGASRRGGMPAYRDPGGMPRSTSPPWPSFRARIPDLDLVFIESGGEQPRRDLLAGTGGPDALRDRHRGGAGTSRARRGPGVTRSDLLIVNKVDPLRPMWVWDAGQLEADAAAARGRPALRHGEPEDRQRGSTGWCGSSKRPGGALSRQTRAGLPDRASARSALSRLSPETASPCSAMSAARFGRPCISAARARRTIVPGFLRQASLSAARTAAGAGLVARPEGAGRGCWPPPPEGCARNRVRREEARDG